MDESGARSGIHDRQPGVAGKNTRDDRDSCWILTGSRRLDAEPALQRLALNLPAYDSWVPGSYVVAITNFGSYVGMMADDLFRSRIAKFSVQTAGARWGKTHDLLLNSRSIPGTAHLTSPQFGCQKLIRQFAGGKALVS